MTMVADAVQAGIDRRFMAAAIRLSRRHLGLTATNPSVATLIVREGVIVGRGVTAVGGRPHAETQALEEAGALARGATAYVTLEPCAHHGRTPPCAEALVSAGIARVVGAACDPDDRVSGKGYEILRGAGLTVEENVLAAEAADVISGYLFRSLHRRPEVTLKLAISADGMIGRRGEGQVEITGPVARRRAHIMRAESDAILIGIGTGLVDDPLLTCRLPGLEDRSPVRIVLDSSLRLPLGSALVRSALQTPLLLAASADADPDRRLALSQAGAGFLAAESFEESIALPELLEDLAARGITTLMVEGGAETARVFLTEDLVDRLVMFTSAVMVGEGGIPSPILPGQHSGFRLVRNERFGDDICLEFVRER